MIDAVMVGRVDVTFLVFFFFKQKTAYEMRISDWSSDVCSSDLESYPNLAQTTYQAVRLMLGDIRPEQFLTGAGEEDGFFDALGNGPVSATDPRALGGDLVGASMEPRR